MLTETRLAAPHARDRARPAHREVRLVERLFGLSECLCDVVPAEHEIGIHIAEHQHVEAAGHRRSLPFPEMPQSLS